MSKKMKTLFFIADFPNVGKANVNIAYDIIKNLEKRGIPVYIYGKYNAGNDSRVIRLDWISHSFCYIQSKNSFFFKILKACYNKFFVNNDVYEKIYLRLNKKIKRVIEKYEIDNLIVFVAPHEYLDVPSLIKEIPVYLYMLDPYSTHYKFGGSQFQYAKEEVALKCVKKVFATKLIYNDYSKSPILCKYLNKVKIVEFPKINGIEFLHSNEKNKYVISFFGNLYKDIRNPFYEIKCFSELSIDNLELNFYGNNYGFDENELKEWEQKYKFLKFHTPISYEDVQDKINSSHFLLNIGNSIVNQMPSKIIEYINTGKPIINFIKSEDCPTLEYVKEYPFAINVLENSFECEKLKKFIIENVNKMVNKKTVIEKYNYCTSEYVGDIVYNELIEGDSNEQV